MGDRLLLCIFLISCSFVFASSEIAIFSLSRLQLKKIKDRSEIQFNRIKVLIQDSIGFLITILLFNEVVNIALASLITTHVVAPLELGWKWETILGVGLTTPIILIFCELTPKVIASRAGQLILSLFLPIVYFLYRVTRPLVSIIRFFIPQTPLREVLHLQEEDFINLAEEQTETGHLNETELELIKNVFEMDDTRVEQLATPLRKVFTITSNMTVDQASQMILKERTFSRIPITGKNKDDIVGVLNLKDLVEVKLNPEMGKESIMVLANDPFIVSNMMTSETLFRKMKAKKVQVAFLKNPQNKVTSMITIQDILDTVIEEAFEE